jgi:hypothetical protein
MDKNIDEIYSIDNEMIELEKKLSLLENKKKNLEVDKLKSLYQDKSLETFLKDLEKSKADIEIKYNIENSLFIKDVKDDKNSLYIKNLVLFEKSYKKKDDDVELYNEYDEKIKKYKNIIEHYSFHDKDRFNKVKMKTIVKGNIQSGKTEYMIVIMLYIVLFIKRSVIIIVRNYTQDRRQFIKRISEFIEKYRKIYKELDDIFLVENILSKKIKLDSKPKIYVLLNNSENISRMNKINILTEANYSLIFDEADLTDASEDSLRRDKDLDFLKKNSDQIIWVSGTVIDKLVKEEGIGKEDIIILKTPKDYKSILSGHIKMKKVQGDMVNKSTKNIFESNPNIQEFLEEYAKEPIFEKQPRICLFSVTNIQKVMTDFQNEIEDRFPNIFSTIVYNGEGTIFRKGNKTIVKSNGISDCLQFLKMNGGIEENHHILIISGLLASRGISFVSDDYKWHLSEQYSLISKTTNEADMLQKIRLHGVYNDDIPLLLYTNVVDDILKAVYKQEELIFFCKENCHDEKDSKMVLKDINLSENKFSKNKKIIRSITRSVSYKPNRVKGDDGGWSDDIYKRKMIVPSKVFAIYDMKIYKTSDNISNKKKIISDAESDDESDIKEDIKDIKDEKQKDEKEESYIYVSSKDLSKQTKETYELIVEYFQENYKSGWIQRSIISKYFQDKGHTNIARINARFEHLIDKGNKGILIDEGLVFKKEENRWYITPLDI